MHRIKSKYRKMSWSRSKTNDPMSLKSPHTKRKLRQVKNSGKQTDTIDTMDTINMDNNKLKFLKEIYKVQSPSGQEDRMKKFIIPYLCEMKGVNFKHDSIENLLVTKGTLKEGEYYPCLVAHLD